MDSEGNPVIWGVPSLSRMGEIYRVSASKVDCDCNVRCNYSNCGACPDMFRCDCSMMVKSQCTTACKHIHLVQMKITGEFDRSCYICILGKVM